MEIYPPKFMIADRYRVIQPPDLDRNIRVGGMGLVYICHDIETDRPVALKTFRPEYLPDREARHHFLEESEAWVRLGRHPHIVRCYDVKYVDPTAFLALELIADEQHPEDVSLCSWIHEGLPMPVEQALLFALQIARGMRYAAEKVPGLVHRDLKPANVLVGGDTLPGTDVNRVRVTDFGLIKIVTEGMANAQVNELVLRVKNRGHFTRGVGTAEYMAPEQWTGTALGVFTDVYALGCILYEMLTGWPVVKGKTLAELRSEHCGGRLRPIPEHISAPVQNFLQSCLRTPAERYQSWEEVIANLEQNYMELGCGPIPEETRVTDKSLEDRRDTASSYNAMGVFHAHMGKPLVALSYFEKAGSLYREIHDSRGEGKVLGNLGSAYSQLGQAGRALPLCQHDLRIAGQNHDRRRESLALGNIGDVYRSLGDPRAAAACYLQRLEIVRRIQDRRGEGNTLGSLGLIYAMLGEWQEAINCYDHQLTVSCAIGDRRGESMALGNLGNAYAQLRRFDDAIVQYQHFMELARTIGDRNREGIAYGNLGNAYLAQGKFNTAIEYFEKRIEIAQQLEDRDGEGIALGNLGTAYARLEQFEKATHYFEQSLEIARERCDTMGEQLLLANIEKLKQKRVDQGGNQDVHKNP